MDTDTALDIAKVVLPFVTFALGLGYGYFDKVKEGRRKQTNTRLILFKEIRGNYQRLNEIWPPDDDLTSIARRFQLFAVLCEGLSTSVYQSYLDRLDILRTDELDKVFEAYYMVGEAIQAGARFNAADRERRVAVGNDERARLDEQARSLAQAIPFAADNAFKALGTALAALPGGEAELQRQLEVRGSKLTRLADLEQALAEAAPTQASATPQDMS